MEENRRKARGKKGGEGNPRLQAGIDFLERQREEKTDEKSGVGRKRRRKKEGWQREKSQ